MAGISVHFPSISWLVVVLVTAAYSIFGIALSSIRDRNLLNDLPNALRVLLAASGGTFLMRSSVFLFPSFGALLIAGSIFLNDEFQRRVADSMLLGRKGGSIALMGIDGSGKSTHANALESWFKERGYYCTNVPFHTYLFVQALSLRSRGNITELGWKRAGNPFRPVLSLIDNLLLTVLTSFGRGAEGRVVIYDRYIWSTYVKYQALGYPVRPLRWLYMLPRPRAAIILDVTIERSLGVIGSRVHHIRYRPEVLSSERQEYLAIAKERSYPIIQSARGFQEVEDTIEGVLARVFPPMKRVEGS